MPRADRPVPRWTEYDGPALRLIEERGQITNRDLRVELGITWSTMDIVLKRLRSRGIITHTHHAGWSLKPPPAERDPSPFPKPWWDTPDVGWWG